MQSRTTLCKIARRTQPIRFSSHRIQSVNQLAKQLSSKCPCIPVNPKNISFIKDPSDFFGHLKHGIEKSRKRIVMSSLYLGSTKPEQELMTAQTSRLKENLEANSGVKVNVLLDCLRGTRINKDGSSSVAMFKDIAAHKNATVALYHTPLLTGLWKKIIPQRINEVVGVQHMKIYLFDDDIIISGANLQKDYFINRQDRYVYIQNEKSLCDYFESLVDTVTSFSYKMDSAGNLSIEPSIDPVNNTSNYCNFASKALKPFYGPSDKYGITMDANTTQQHDTLVFPTLQAGSFGVRNDEEVISHLLRNAEPKSKIFISSPYLNLTSNYKDIIMNRSKAFFDILTASPKANAFFTAKDISGFIPQAYGFIEKQFFDDVCKLNQQDRIQIYEYIRDQWTFHAKGLWYSPTKEDNPILTVIGSANLGQRSAERDFESQLVILSSNEKLQNQLKEECDYLVKEHEKVTEKTFQKEDRHIDFRVRLASKFLADYM